MQNIVITEEDINEMVKEYHGDLAFDECRIKAIIGTENIQACAGSGKTTLVAAKLLILAKKWSEKYSGICVLTHTNIARDEILEKIVKHKSGFKLLGYPHFIGTIQEFVNTFLAIPYIRSTGKKITNIDDDICVNVIQNKMSQRAKTYLERKHNPSLYDFQYSFCNGKMIPTVPGFPKKSDSPTYEELLRIKREIINDGYYYYKEMYSLSEMVLYKNQWLPIILQKRFPYVFMDEMQDTQRFQDELINRIFMSEDVVLQKFGDPDQAIFDGIGGEIPNESYNNADLGSIEDSHRFGNDIARLITGISYKRLSLNSSREEQYDNVPHTIFLFNDQSISKIIDEYGKLVNDCFTKHIDNLNRAIKIKAVGGIGKKGESVNSLAIPHYWDKFEKTRNKRVFKAKKLIHIVKKCSTSFNEDTSENYNLLINGVLEFLRRANKKHEISDWVFEYFTKSSLISELKNKDQYLNFRRVITSFVLDAFPSEEKWNKQIVFLMNVLDINANEKINDNAKDYLSYERFEDVIGEKVDKKENITNFYNYNDLTIEVATIHSVKGETHDATLILETKFNRLFDLKEIIPYLIDDKKVPPKYDPEHPLTNDSIIASFIKRIYVAVSRPRYLLCLAMKSDHLTSKQREELIKKGWQIKDLL